MMPTTESEKLALVEEARQLWGEEVARLLAEDLGLTPKPPPDPSETRH